MMESNLTHKRLQNRNLSRRFVERKRAEGYTPTSLYLQDRTKEILDRVKREQGFSNRSEAVEFVTLSYERKISGPSPTVRNADEEV